MNRERQRILFLQLPRLDNESSGPRENLPIAGLYLLHTLEKANLKPHEARFLTPEEEDLDDEHLLECIVDWRPDIIAAIRRAILSEPHMLWQFFLSPEGEEPLDLLTEMTAEIRRHSSHWIDRFAHGAGWDRIASRRIFILLKRPLPYSPSWIRAAETLLEDHFYWQNEKAPPFTVNRFHAMNVVGYEFLALVRVDSPCSSLS